MAYRPPTFNLACNIRTPPVPPAPVRIATLCNLSPGRRDQTIVSNPFGPFVDRQYVHILFPKLTDVRGITVANPNGDAVEVPTGSGRWYQITWVEDVAKGFPNEYRMCIAIQNLNVAFAPVWPQPTP